MSEPMTTELTRSGYDVAKTVLGRQKVLRRLGPRHKLIIALHLQGLRGPEIAARIGCSASRVYSTLKDPSAKIVIEHFNEGFELDIKALYPKAIKAISDAMEVPATAMSAVDRFMKLAGKEEKPDAGGINVTIMGNARLKLVQELKEVSDNVIDLQPSDVSDG